MNPTLQAGWDPAYVSANHAAVETYLIQLSYCDVAPGILLVDGSF